MIYNFIIIGSDPNSILCYCIYQVPSKLKNSDNNSRLEIFDSVWIFISQIAILDIRKLQKRANF